MLKEQNIKSLWISARSNLQRKLEQELDVVSLKLKPLEKKDQIEFLKTYWKVTIEADLSDDRLVEFCAEILSQFSHSIGDQQAQFSGIPLQLRMVAEIFTELCEQFCSPPCCGTAEELKGNIKLKMNLIDLYEEFFRIKFEVILNEEKERMNLASINVQQQLGAATPGIIEAHRILAVFALQDEGMRRKILSPDEIVQGNKLLEKVSDSREKTGIVYRIVNGQPIFVHQTFAEYFLADFVGEKINQFTFETEVLVEDFMRNDREQVCRFLQQKIHKITIESKLLKQLCKVIVCKSVKYMWNYATAVLLKTVDVLMNDQNCDSSTILDGSLPANREGLYCTSERLGIINLTKCFKVTFAPWNIDVFYGHEQLMLGPVAFNSRTVLHDAASRGHSELVTHCIGRGADIDVTIKPDLETPLMYLSRFGHSEVVAKLLERNANVNAVNDSKKTALHIAAESSMHKSSKQRLAIIKMLVNAGADVEAITKRGETPLMLASKCGHVDVADILLSKKIDINTADLDGWTALHWAAFEDHPQIIEKLLSAGANVNATTNSGETALMLATKHAQSEAIELLRSNASITNATG
ncbi:uncharacterized protein LOC129731694 [Wyeomyia smithii]|uniref:uncharacterized protein LOC129731694 n=1 Tax=Wyeomyia smithii TaxID=174621 RepID=UPI002467B3BA|nr:uncharacterized protein LOC129731694 [Wyeomyia smithii]